MRPHHRVVSIFFFSILLLGRLAAQEQSEFRWARSFPGEACSYGSYESIIKTMYDSVGNMYIYGTATPGAEWNGRRMLDSDTLIWQHCKMSLFLAKVDTCGELVWCKSARDSYSNITMPTYSAYNMCDMDIRNGKIYVFGKLAFSPDAEYKRDSAWLFFFDTLYRGIIDYSDPWYYDVHGYPFEASEMTRLRSNWNFFAVLDLDGNLIDQHSFYVSLGSGRPELASVDSAGNGAINGIRLRIDSQGNICTFVCFSTNDMGDWDSLRPLYMIVAEDSSRTRIPLFQSGEQSPLRSLFLKFDTNWNIIVRKPLMERLENFHHEDIRCQLSFAGMDIDEEDNIYLNGMASDLRCRSFYPQDSFPTYLYIDSLHSLKFEGRLMQHSQTPYVAKYDNHGNLLWLTQAAYSDWTIDSSLMALSVGKCHHDATSVYTTLTVLPYVNPNAYPDEPDMHLYYFDSAHTDTFPDLRQQNGGNTFYFIDQLLAFDKETGELTRHWILDSVSAMSSHSGLEETYDVRCIPWENSVATVKFSRVEYGAHDLVKVHLADNSVTQGQRIWGTGGNVNIHPNGWVSRESTGRAGNIPEQMFPGTDTVVHGRHIMSFYYDSTLDLRRRYQCPAPSGLTATRQNATEARVAWTASEGNNLWMVCHGPEGTPPGEGIIDTLADDNVIILTGLDSGTRYEVYLRAACEYTPQRFPGYPGSYPTRPPLSGWTGPVTIDTLPHTGIGSASPNSKKLFTLSPNPATGMVTVTVGNLTPPTRGARGGLEQISLTLTDAEGREVLRKEFSILPHSGPDPESQFPIHLPLPAGTYFVTITTTQGSATQRLIVK